METERRLERIYVATPCPANWERMPGDERVRFCDSCGLHVYNISAMTRAEADSLVARTEGRLCVRLFRRADGTVLTKDCPVGLRLWRRRVSRAAGAALTAVLSLFGGLAATAATATTQGQAAYDSYPLKVKRKRAATKDARPVLDGTVYDINRAVIYDASVTLKREGGDELKTTTNDEGQFYLMPLEPGTYTLNVYSPGFVSFSKKLELKAGENVSLDLTLEVGSVGGAAFLPAGAVPDRIAAD